MRHAKSSWKDERLGDRERPLNKRGMRDAPRMGELLLEHDLVPDCIISSAATRARQTAALLAEAAGYEGEIIFDPALYGGASEDFARALSKVAPGVGTVLVVGHNPDLEDLLELLSGTWERMPTAAIAQLQLPIDRWSSFDLDAGAQLIRVWRPRELS
jgi:phosphohistidine phosphatase